MQRKRPTINHQHRTTRQNQVRSRNLSHTPTQHQRNTTTQHKQDFINSNRAPQTKAQSNRPRPSTTHAKRLRQRTTIISQRQKKEHPLSKSFPNTHRTTRAHKGQTRSSPYELRRHQQPTQGTIKEGQQESLHLLHPLMYNKNLQDSSHPRQLQQKIRHHTKPQRLFQRTIPPQGRQFNKQGSPTRLFGAMAQ